MCCGVFCIHNAAGHAHLLKLKFVCELITQTFALGITLKTQQHTHPCSANVRGGPRGIYEKGRRRDYLASAG